MSIQKFKKQHHARKAAKGLGRMIRKTGRKYEGREVVGVEVCRLPLDPDNPLKFPGYGLKYITRGLQPAGPSMLSSRFLDDLDVASVLRTAGFRTGENTDACNS